MGSHCFNGIQWDSTVFNGIPSGSHWILLNYVPISTPIPLSPIDILNQIQWDSIILMGFIWIQWDSIGLNGIQWDPNVLMGFIGIQWDSI